MSEAISPFRVVVLLSGRGSNFEALLAANRDDPGDQSGFPPPPGGRATSRTRAFGTREVDFPLVVSDNAEAGGLEIARAAGVPTAVVERQPKLRTAEEFNVALADAVEAANPDLVVLAGFMRVLLSPFVRRFPRRIINIHPSLLPSFRGLHAQAQAVRAGVRFAGCTVHVVEEEVDAGPILAQAVVPVLPDDTAESLAARILNEEHRLLPAVVRAFAAGEVRIADENGVARARIAGETGGQTLRTGQVPEILAHTAHLRSLV